MDRKTINELNQELAAAHEQYAVAESQKDVQGMAIAQNRVITLMARLEDASRPRFEIGNE